MRIDSLILCIISTLLFISHVNSYGESQNGYPNFQERESHNLMNLVRMFPNNYKNEYMSGYSGVGNILNVPAVKPVWYNYTINRLARSHSIDMGENGCFSHDSCDGTNIWARFKDFINCAGAGSQSENIAAGLSTGFATNNQLLCDKPSGSTSCATDGSGDDGHRKNIMSAKYSNVGVGQFYSESGNFPNYWTQDFTSGSCSLPETPIYSGYHFMYPQNNPQFIAIYYNTSMPCKSMSLVFANGTEIPMPIKYGVSTAAAYSVNLVFEFCAQYYFQAITTSGSIYRYPDEGFLQLTTNSTCDGWTDGNTSSKTIASFSLLIILSLFSILIL